MAKATAQDVAAQWRPAIAPGHNVEVEYDAETQHVLASLRNVGAGAAYYIDAGLDLGPSIIPAAAWTRDGKAPSNFAVLPAGETIDIHFSHVDEKPGNSCEIIADYEDVAGASYSTRIEVHDLPTWYPEARATDALRMTRVELTAGDGIVPWNKPPSLWFRTKRRVADYRDRKNLVKIPPSDTPF